MKNSLIAIYSLFILFLVGSAIFASRTFDGDVDNAYEKGMQYPVELEKIENLGWNFSVINHKMKTDTPGKIELVIQNNDDTPVKGAEVSMELSLLTKPYSIPSQTAPENSPGHYIASVVLPVQGHWQVDTQITFNGETMKHRFKIYIEKGK